MAFFLHYSKEKTGIYSNWQQIIKAEPLTIKLGGGKEQSAHCAMSLRSQKFFMLSDQDKSAPWPQRGKSANPSGTQWQWIHQLCENCLGPAHVRQMLEAWPICPPVWQISYLKHRSFPGHKKTFHSARHFSQKVKLRNKKPQKLPLYF